MLPLQKVFTETEISFVTTCKGRLHHIQETLPLIVEQSPGEVIVVDYGCPQKVGDWVAKHFPDVTVVRVDDDPGFCAARARNLGARAAKSPWLCFIDGDIKIAPGWVGWMRQQLDQRFFYRADFINGARDPETWGTAVCTRAAFKTIGGYDEAFRGWGGEDDDLYFRLESSGLAEAVYPQHFVSAISHDDQERVAFYSVKDRKIHYLINQFYNVAKRQIIAISGRKSPLSQDLRQSLMAKIVQALLDWESGKSTTMPSLTFTVKGKDWLPPPYKMLKKCTFTLTLDVLPINDRDS